MQNMMIMMHLRCNEFHETCRRLTSARSNWLAQQEIACDFIRKIRKN